MRKYGCMEFTTIVAADIRCSTIAVLGAILGHHHLPIYEIMRKYGCMEFTTIVAADSQIELLIE